MVENSKTYKVIMTVLVSLLIVAVLVCVGFVIYDKVLKKEPSIQDNNPKEEVKYLEVEISKDDQDILNTLVMPYDLDALVEELFDFNINNMSRNELMLMASSLIAKDRTIVITDEEIINEPIDDGRYYKVGDEIYTSYITEEALKKEFTELFGSDKTYTSGSFGEESCYIPTVYDEKNKRYWAIDLCGFDTPYEYNFLFNKLEKTDEEINVYYNQYVYDSSDDNIYSEIKYTGEGNIDTSKLLKKVIDLGDFDKSVINAAVELQKENKLKTYKFTFKKQSDGNYYIESGSYEK